MTELDQLPRMRVEFPVPSEPNMLFYVQRSVNSNTVVYAARLDADGAIDPKTPVDAFWRWYNVDGQKKPLNFIEYFDRVFAKPFRWTYIGRPLRVKPAA